MPPRAPPRRAGPGVVRTAAGTVPAGRAVGPHGDGRRPGGPRRDRLVHLHAMPAVLSADHGHHAGPAGAAGRARTCGSSRSRWTPSTTRRKSCAPTPNATAPRPIAGGSSPGPKATIYDLIRERFQLGVMEAPGPVGSDTEAIVAQRSSRPDRPRPDRRPVRVERSRGHGRAGRPGPGAVALPALGDEPARRVNAGLNGLSACLLFAGWILIRRYRSAVADAARDQATAESGTSERPLGPSAGPGPYRLHGRGHLHLGVVPRLLPPLSLPGRQHAVLPGRLAAGRLPSRSCSHIPSWRPSPSPSSWSRCAVDGRAGSIVTSPIASADLPDLALRRRHRRRHLCHALPPARCSRSARHPACDRHLATTRADRRTATVGIVRDPGEGGHIAELFARPAALRLFRSNSPNTLAAPVLLSRIDARSRCALAFNFLTPVPHRTIGARGHRLCCPLRRGNSAMNDSVLPPCTEANKAESVTSEDFDSSDAIKRVWIRP